MRYEKDHPTCGIARLGYFGATVVSWGRHGWLPELAVLHRVCIVAVISRRGLRSGRIRPGECGLRGLVFFALGLVFGHDCVHGGLQLVGITDAAEEDDPAVAVRKSRKIALSGW